MGIFGTQAGFYEIYPSVPATAAARETPPTPVPANTRGATPVPAAATTASAPKVPVGEEPMVVVAANLQDATESDVLPAKELHLAGKKAAEITKAEIVEKDLWVWHLFAALAITMVEWFTYHRRITV